MNIITVVVTPVKDVLSGTFQQRYKLWNVKFYYIFQNVLNYPKLIFHVLLHLYCFLLLIHNC